MSEYIQDESLRAPLQHIESSNKIIMCDGKLGQEDKTLLAGHPKIYLSFGSRKEIRCPYCSQSFIYKA